MPACLFIPELSAIIISHATTNSDLLSIALTNRFLSNIALDFLWRDLKSADPIYAILPTAEDGDKQIVRLQCI